MNKTTTKQIDNSFIELNIINNTCNLSKDYIPLPELLSELGISRSTVSSWQKKGLIVNKVGGLNFISKKNLEKFMKQFEI